MSNSDSRATIRIAADLHRRVKVEAAKLGLSITEVVERSLRDWLEQVANGKIFGPSAEEPMLVERRKGKRDRRENGQSSFMSNTRLK